MMLVTAATLVSAIVEFIAASRTLCAMGRERALPGSFARLSTRRTPIISIGYVAVLTLVLGLPLTYADGGVQAFVNLAGAAGLSGCSCTLP